MFTEYQIEYHTRNAYELPVSEAIFEFLVAPCANDTQEVNQIRFRHTLGGEIHQHPNVFGFTVASIRTTRPFTEFECWMNATVMKQSPEMPVSRLSVAEERTLLTSPEFYIEHHLYLTATKYTTIYAADRDKILVRPSGQSTLDYLTALTQYVHNLIQFDANTTDVHTTASDVIQLQKGVCQDFTHVFLAMARAHGIPSRYTSGYLNQGDGLIGSAVMHAWVEAYVPGSGWCGFDPTNNRPADIHHIKAAHGVDYSDCSPIKGILKTNGDNRTEYKVSVVPRQVEMAEQ